VTARPEPSPPTRWERLRGGLPRARSFRSWTIDANDGIIATSGILEGFAGAGATHSVLVTAATAATVAGALGLGGSTWAEEAAEREAQLELAAEERAQLDADPAAEVAELATHYERKGLAPALAREVAEQLTAHDALAAQLDAEHGIEEVMSRAAPVWAGVSAAIAFTLGAAVPLLITLSVSAAVESWAIFVAAVASLTLTSLVASRAGDLSVSRTLARTLTVGVGTLAVSYLAGRILF
jgi:VIT1/CCC1 family predicted Fe2+/Mn2+ transporter